MAHSLSPIALRHHLLQRACVQLCNCSGVGASSYLSFNHKQTLCCPPKVLLRNWHTKCLKYLFVGVSENEHSRNNSDSSWERIVQHVELAWDS